MWKPLPIFLAITGCTPRLDLAETGEAEDSSTEPEDSATEPMEDPLAEVDVLVIGSGPAGLAAAWEARESGAEVLVIERASLAGGSGWYASNYFGVLSTLQQAQNIPDSHEFALEEWSEFTNGGDPTDPWVQRLVYESAGTLDWLESFGIEFDLLDNDPGAGSLDRIHAMSELRFVVEPMIEDLEGVFWFETQADQLVLEDGSVIGAEVTLLATEQSGWIRAESTIVATGGFARDLDRVRQDRPELKALVMVNEGAPTSVSLGIQILETAGVQIQNQGNFGVYYHSLQDPREGREDEALWIPWLPESILVDSTGSRVANESAIFGFQMVDITLAVPGQQLWLISSPDIAEYGLAVPAYLWADPDVIENIGLDEAMEIGALAQGKTGTELAASLGILASGLEDQLTEYAQMVEAGEDHVFGRDAATLESLGAGPYIGAPLVAGSAKAFVGARVDTDARVLDLSGEIIPGLLAAGEAAGFLGSDAVGEGFSGSITACFLMGRVAGQSAAE